MSFSAVAKDELARVAGQHSCCSMAELAALVKMDGSIQISGARQLSLNIVTENIAVARKIFSLVRKLFGLYTEVRVRRNNRLRNNNVYIVHLPPQPGMNGVLRRLGLMDSAGRLQRKVSERLVHRDCCRRAYLRGVFLGGGSVNNPEGNYHLEIITGQESFAKFVARLMARYGLSPKISRRKNSFLLYLKEGEQIAAFLNVIGAHAALLDFENTRIYKDMRNQVNRLVNCETANLNKTVNASLRQLENIELIKATLGLDKLPKALRDTALLRIKYPDASLKELGSMMQPQLGKSGVNHRLRKLEEIAERIRERKT
ncbi:MAG: DNA-binding protein WhiA [Pelotomaculum sp.]